MSAEGHGRQMAADPGYAEAHRPPTAAEDLDSFVRMAELPEPSAQEVLDDLIARGGDEDDICDIFAVSPEVARQLMSGELRLIDVGEWPAYMIADDRGNLRPELMPPTVDDKKGLTTIGGAPHPN
jgi:hypothetical protein